MISGNLQGGVVIQGDSNGTAANNLVEGDYIGTDATGSLALGNGSLQSGVAIVDSTNNLIGGTALGAGNLIAGNSSAGIQISSLGVVSPNDNRIEGNRIGTDATGATRLGNGVGVSIVAGQGNTVGGTVGGAQNLISGNSTAGIGVVGSGSTPTANNLIAGNLIGTNASGASSLSNQDQGVLIVDSSMNTVGGTTAAAANIIAGSGLAGVEIISDGTLAAANNLIEGNFIGTNASGAALGNRVNGVTIADASGNTVGGTTTAARNVISGNSIDGVLLTSDGAAPTSNNLVEGNYIGTDPTGALALGNGADGVGLDAAVGNAIGGAAQPNLISGNLGRGVDIFTGSNTNTVQGNLIGTDAAGTAALGNTIEGVAVDGSTGNLIGGTASGTGNLISGNLGRGVDIFNGATGNLVQGNDIGTALGGTGALATTMPASPSSRTTTRLAGSASRPGTSSPPIPPTAC